MQILFLSFLIWLREFQGFFFYDSKIASWGNIPLLHLDWTPGQWELLATLFQIFDFPQNSQQLCNSHQLHFFSRITVNHPGARISASNLSFREGFKAHSDPMKSILIATFVPEHQNYIITIKTVPTWRLCSFVRQWLPGVCQVKGCDKSIYSKSVDTFLIHWANFTNLACHQIVFLDEVATCNRVQNKYDIIRSNIRLIKYIRPWINKIMHCPFITHPHTADHVLTCSRLSVLLGPCRNFTHNSSIWLSGVSAQKDHSEARSNNDQQSKPACMFSGCGSVSFSLKSISKLPKDIAHRCSFPGHNWNKPNERTKPRAFNEWRHLQICRAATHAGLDEALNLASLTTWVTPSYIDRCNIFCVMGYMEWYGKTFNQNLQIISMIKLDPRTSVVCWPCDSDVSTPVGITMLEGTKRGTLGSTWRMLETWCERGNMRHNDRNYPQILAKRLSIHQMVGFGYPPATTGFPNIHESWHMTWLQRWMLINY